MFKKMTMVRVRAEIGGPGSERSPSPSPWPVLSILCNPARGTEDGRSPACDARERIPPTLNSVLLALAPPKETAFRDLDLTHDLDPSGRACTFKEKPLESGCGFDTQETGGEMLTRRDCPGKAPPCTLSAWDREVVRRRAEYRGQRSEDRGGEGRDSGVKAVEGNRTPSPGGNTARLGRDEHPCGLHRGVDTAVGALVGMRRWSKMGWGFVLQDAGGEWVMRNNCPELRRLGRQGSGLSYPKESDALVLGWRPNRERGARASCALTAERRVEFERGAGLETCGTAAGFSTASLGLTRIHVWSAGSRGLLPHRILPPCWPSEQTATGSRVPEPAQLCVARPPCWPSEQTATGRSDTCPTRRRSARFCLICPVVLIPLA